MFKALVFTTCLFSLSIFNTTKIKASEYFDPSDLDQNNTINTLDVNQVFKNIFLNQFLGDINNDKKINLLDSVILLNSIYNPVSKQKIQIENSSTNYKLIFSDDFNTDVPLGSFPLAVSNKWDAYPYPWQDTSKNGYYYPEKVVSIQDGMMNMFIHSENINGVIKHLVAAPQPKLNTGIGNSGNGLKYGKVVIRFRADALPNYKTAWLLWPDSNIWPKDGEIDFPEGNLDSTINAFMHKQNAVSGTDQAAFSTEINYNDWHTAVIEWLPNKCTFILDDIVVGTSTDRVPNTSMHYVLQTETALGPISPNNSTQGNAQIDWIVIYKYINAL